MHMGDALISPAVGGVMLAVSGGGLAYSIKKAGREADLRKISLAGVMGAFVFA
ncbi:MAG: energy-coupling factor ABC transporter permease, partial [Oscillospiraceae bacterium]|nr:energy-coupling factor ABC transporter permease [Oscillospiraceae bacterium]